jgi:uncharacterized protein (DUF1697 family)
MVKMEVLRSIFEGLGCENVRTYINSGNIGFDHKRTAESTLVSKLENAIEKGFGRRFSVIIREQKAISSILEKNPFEGEYESHKEMHVLFLAEEPTKEQSAQLMAASQKGERYEIRGREIYCHLKSGFANSLLTKGVVDKKLKLLFTARNWRTVEKLAEL